MGRSGGAVGIVGLGLIGGSLAKTLKTKDPRRRVIGVEPDEKARALAQADRLFDPLIASPTRALGDCEIVILCAPVASVEALLEPVSREMDDQAILTDVCGVKERIVTAARTKVRRPVQFVGAHPMFGGEKGGYAAARPDLWKGGTVAVCVDGAEESAVERVAGLHRGLGAEVVLCTAAEHDQAVASVSHLPYLLASALALTAGEAGPLARKLAGKGLSDMTRLAEFVYEVQGEAARANSHLPAAAKFFEVNLRALLDALTGSPEAARAALARARTARESLRAPTR